MLKQLYIRDFALVERLELDLATGMTVLTGETGAGKSILLDALGLTLGDRADSDVVRHGSQRAEVAATFDVRTLSGVTAWLAEQELDQEEPEVQIRRTVSADGRSKGYINGNPAPIQQLRELGELLVDIHGQHAHQSLLKKEIQRQLLDDYAMHEALVNQVADLFRRWRRQHEAFARLTQSASERADRQGLLRYQVEELEALDLSVDELDALDAEHNRLAHASRLLGEGQGALARLSEGDEGNALSLLESTLAELQELAGFDARLGPICELLDGAVIQAGEAAAELRHYLSDVEVDPQRLEWVEERLDAIHQLSRKHQVRPEELPTRLQTLQAELAELDAADDQLGGMQADLEGLLAAYREAADALGTSRAAAAERLGGLVSANMQELGMGNGRFAVELERDAQAEPSAHGWERVEFRVSANPGQPLRPLGKVASGGELSRISLAIQVITAGKGRIPTLIFDEVDVGIGGGVAEMVGRQLRTLASKHQILCVTHQPQVAAQGHNHLQISKSSDGETTASQVVHLALAERVEEIARMLGGLRITEQTLSHAREMLDLAAAEG